MKTILITGATSGIGEAIALRFARENYRLILCGRRNEKLKELSAKIETNYNTQTQVLNFDIRKNSEVVATFNSLPNDWKDIDILLNNAGLASGLSTIQEGDIEDWEKMIDTNIKGLLYITRIISPFMVKRGKGHIINIGSIAGKEVYLNGNVYCATKHAVDALNKAMRIDLLPYGIKVTQIAPGAVETEFSLVRFHGDPEKAAAVYKGYKPLCGDDIAETAYFVANLPEHVNINDIVIVPIAQASTTAWNKK